MMGTHLALVVPGCVGIAHSLFPSGNWFNFIMALLLSTGIVFVIWTLISLVYGLQQKSKQ